MTIAGHYRSIVFVRDHAARLIPRALLFLCALCFGASARCQDVAGDLVPRLLADDVVAEGRKPSGASQSDEPGGSRRSATRKLSCNETLVMDRGNVRQWLETADPVAQRRRLYHLTFDPHRQTRVFELEYLRKVKPDRLLHNRILDLARTASDPIVRGHARLIAADWGPTPPSSGSNLARLPQITNVPESYVAQVAFQDGAVVRSAVSRFVPADDAKPLESSHADDLFAPITPFWESSTSTYAGVPADAGSDRRPDPLLSLVSMQPRILDRPIDLPPVEDSSMGTDWSNVLLSYEMDAPLGFTGPSGIMPTEIQENSDFVPVEDRWRIGFPQWDRYERGFPIGDDYPFKEGRLLDPYNQNVLKGDFPIIGQHTFFNVTAMSFTDLEYRQVPTATTPFESTVHPFSEPFSAAPINSPIYTTFVSPSNCFTATRRSNRSTGESWSNRSSITTS